MQMRQFGQYVLQCQAKLGYRVMDGCVRVLDEELKMIHFFETSSGVNCAEMVEFDN